MGKPERNADLGGSGCGGDWRQRGLGSVEGDDERREIGRCGLD